VIPDPRAETALEAKRLSQLGFLACTAGNLSCRLADGVIAMSPSGVDKGSLSPEDFILLGDDGRPRPPDTRKPSDETALHVSLYALVGCGAVCHGHPPHAVALSLGPASLMHFQGIEMQKAFSGTTTHAGSIALPVIDNSQDMAELAARAAQVVSREIPALVVRGHGVYAWGRSPKEASRHLETVEWLCRLRWLCRAAGIDG